MLDGSNIVVEPRKSEDAAQQESRNPGYRFFMRPILDAVGTFLILCLISLAFGAGPSSASPNVPSAPTFPAAQTLAAMKAVADADVRPVVEIATTSSSANADAVYHRTSAQAAWALILLGLSAAAALNMALLRHLRQAYATPQRRQSQN